MKNILTYAACSLFFFSATTIVAHANHPEPQSIMVDETRTQERQNARARGRINRILLRSDPNPCNDAHGLQRQQCLTKLRKEGNWVDVRGYRVRSFPAENRRTAALKARADRKKGVLIPRGTGEFRNIDLHAQMPRIRFQPNKSVEGSLSQNTQNDRPLLQSRAVAGRRKIGTSQRLWDASPQLCSRRRGIRLINCLNEMGIAINRNTLDAGTLRIWERLRKQ